MSSVQKFVIFLGRVLISAMFLFTAFYGFNDWESSIAYIAERGIPYPQAFFIVTKALYALGGLMLLFGWRTRIGAFILLAVLGTSTYLFHDFWNMEEPEEFGRHLKVFAMMLGTFGALLYVLACGAGCCCCDQTCSVEEDLD